MFTTYFDCQVFDPAEIKARRLQDEDRAVASIDRPERYQIVNSSLSDNPIFAAETLFPPPEFAAQWAYSKISVRTQYLFCAMHADGSYPPANYNDPNDYRPPAERRSDLGPEFIKAVALALDMLFVQNLEVPYLWHYKRDAFSVLEDQGGRSVQFLERDELWALYELGLRYRAINARCEQIRSMWAKIKELRPDIEDDYLTNTLLPYICTKSIEAAAEGYNWLLFHYPDEIRHIKEDETIEEGGKRLVERSLRDETRSGPIMKLVEAFGIDVAVIGRAFSDPDGMPTPPKSAERMPLDLAEEFAGPGTYIIDAEEALKGEYNFSAPRVKPLNHSRQVHFDHRVPEGPNDPPRSP